MFEPAKAMRLLVGKSGFADKELGQFLGFDEDKESSDDEVDVAKLRIEIGKLHRKLDKRQADKSLPKYCRKNLEEFGRAVGLDQTEGAILLLLSMSAVEPVVQDAFRLFQGLRKLEYIEILSRTLGVPVDAVQNALSGQGILIRSSLMGWDSNASQGKFVSIRNDSLAKILLSEDFSMDKAIRTIVVPSNASTLGYRDFPHVQETLDYLRPYLRSVLRNQSEGVNIYIHGAPGTGKSELTRVLAREMKARLFEVSTEDEDGDPIKGLSRIQSLREAQSLLSKYRTLLVFDEAEDIFSGKSYFQRSLAAERKGWMNRYLESNPVPTFWLSNSRRELDPAFVRRFDFVFELTNPPKRQRLRTFRRICRKSISENAVRRLAQCESLTPAVVAKAHDVCERIGSVQPAIRKESAMLHLVEQTLKAQGHDKDSIRTGKNPVPKVFDLTYLNSDPPLEEVVSQFKKDASCRICLYGPPGTGKTTFGYWLANRLDLPVHVRKASDILSPYVGETEQNLAQIFLEARTEAAILMIDEVDTFLRVRSDAVQSWEVSQVNEMLTQMERFEGIFIASTNMMDGLDQASLRRFDLKIALGFLLEAQVCSLFERHCLDLRIGRPGKILLEEATRISNATPGDFANAARQHRFRRFSGPAAFLEAVAEECKMKKTGNRRKVGF